MLLEAYLLPLLTIVVFGWLGYQNRDDGIGIVCMTVVVAVAFAMAYSIL
jgi:positive regulator of sigma E activity